ncbi:hypothetical protein S83_051079 [Arachis hypogaea]
MRHTTVAHGHVATQYAFSMMLMLCNNNDDAKKKGIETFRVLEESDALTICKVGFREVIKHSRTTQRRVPIRNGENQVCVSHTCPSRGNMGAIYHYQCHGREWHVNDGDGGASHVLRIHCRADYELILFVNLFY